MITLYLFHISDYTFWITPRDAQSVAMVDSE